MSLTKIALLMIAGAFVWLGAEYMEDRNNPTRHRVPTRADLQDVSGKLVGARVVDVKTKKGVLFNHYTELDINGPERPIKVRVSEPHSERDLAGLDGEDLTATFDPVDNNLVYSLKAKDREVISYEKSMNYKTRLVESNGGGYTLGWIVLGLGVAGLWLGRKPLR